MTNTTETRRPFLNRNTGLCVTPNGAKKTYALMMGAYLTKDADYRRGENGKKNQLRCNIAINVNPWSLLGEEVEKAHVGDPYTSADKPFMQLVAFGDLADRYVGLKKGAKIFFAGPISVQTFKRTNGEEGAAVQVIANELIVASSKAGAGDGPKDGVYCMTNVYADKTTGQEKTQKLCLITGTVRSSKELNVTPTGREVRNFTIEVGMSATKAEALCNGTFSETISYPESRYVNLGRWGEAAKHLDKVLIPGNVVAVLASLNVREGDDGARYVNGTARDISVLRWAQSAQATAQAPAQATTQAPAQASAPAPTQAMDSDSNFAPGGEFAYADLDDDDDDVPF